MASCYNCGEKFNGHYNAISRLDRVLSDLFRLGTDRNDIGKKIPHGAKKKAKEIMSQVRELQKLWHSK